MSSDPSAKRPRRTVRVGKYDVVSHIATGGMGAVYKAIDTVLKREVALKVLPPDMASKPNALERFRREARNAAKLRHENIVTIYEFSQSGTTFYLAMEFVEGIDLQEYIDRKGRLDPEEARLIALQATRALEHAHTQGVVHRDIKPSNFLVTRKGDTLVVKMSDFGLARETTDEEARVTRDGHTVGTVDYMAPEQARDCGSADCRSDVYSLGCTVFHMLTGKAPFPEGSIPERLYKHAHDEPPDLRRPQPARLRGVLRRGAAHARQGPRRPLPDSRPSSSKTSFVWKAPRCRHGQRRAGRDWPSPPARSPKRSRAANAGRRAPSALTRQPVPPPRPRGRRGEDPAGRAAGAGRRSCGGAGLRGPWVWALCGGAVAVVLAVVAVIVGLRSPPPRDPGTQVNAAGGRGRSRRHRPRRRAGRAAARTADQSARAGQGDVAAALRAGGAARAGRR